MAFKDRIKEARLNKKMTQEQLAQKIGVAKSTVTGYEKGNSEPNMLTVSKMMEALNVDANYLWQDEMAGNFPEKVSYDELTLIEKYRQLDTYGKDTIDYLLSRELDRYNQFKQQQTEQHEAELQVLKEEYQDQLDLYARRIPYGGTANNAPPIPKKGHKMVKINQFEGAYGAGGGQYNDNTEMVTIEVPEDELPEGADTTMHVAGNSMEPTLSHGDSVYIQHTDTLNIGDIGVFYLDGECFIKEYGDDELISHNPEYAPIQISEFSTFVIQGKVLGKKIEGFVEL
ncbi:XRE family transcriptional regulator [Eubacterium limosum]|uniref:HTH cro/C1-type domain-containing protein n=1 Tax=Eubacterium limosum TaxID=1736 RepID=A0AAC9QUR5_EUBLI|nr:S24 family peptidase [Eubacterium limosum]ARD66067.1 hypothetical protein B2M23_11175 [Eubacterium limosum]PWW46707.1 peptidase S24-like protein [Eubacterium limosum]UQZ22600.1 helix-turn-helix domain-containing protein [Eubacterium limosum]